MKRGAYYNEIDPFAAEWLRNLIAAGQIAPGDVDTRPIQEVQPDDLAGYTQCHFFAGIGGWSLAARLAGWPDDRSIWTGSCPCQPFSVAGRRKGVQDERHLDEAKGAGPYGQSPGRGLHVAGFWDDWTLIGPDPEGKYRRIKSSIATLDTRLPGHVGQIRGYGNAICPELAAEVIRAWMDVANAARAEMEEEC